MNTPVVEVVSDSRCNPKVQRLVIFGVVLAIVATVLGIVLPRVLGSESTPPSPTAAPIPKDLIDLLSNISFDKGEALLIPSTPQNNALIWLANNTYIGNYTNESKVQCYVLVMLYYSTNRDSTWNKNFGWLLYKDECTDWYNSAGEPFCSDNGAVIRLGLASNKLDGTIPEEIALLSNSLGECLLQVFPIQLHTFIL